MTFPERAVAAYDPKDEVLDAEAVHEKDDIDPELSIYILMVLRRNRCMTRNNRNLNKIENVVLVPSMQKNFIQCSTLKSTSR